MPIYGFECAACGHRFDRLQKLSDPDPEACPACGAVAVRRQITAPAFRLAGAGWYETDFKKDGDRKRNLAGEGGGEAGGKADAASAGSGDSKAATPATTAPAAPSKPPAGSD
jgi:putative FmdB family regulatory protein